MGLTEWLAIGGFVVMIGGNIVLITRTLEGQKQAFDKKLSDEIIARTRALAEAVESRNEEMEKMRRDWAESQTSQDRQFGEVGLSLRRFIETVEKDMHEAELWGRDHYVQKADFEKAVDKLSAEIKAGNADLKAEFKEMKKELSKH